MSYRNNRFNLSMESLELQNDISDNRQGVERMLDEIEPLPDDSPDPNQELAGAVLRLIVAGKEYLVETLLLIVKYCDEREISMKYVPKRTYFRHRNELTEFFVAL